MASTGFKSVSLSCLIMLAGCGGMSGDWPNLSDPLPDASERERVLERRQPVPPSAPVSDMPDSPLTQEGAVALMVKVQAEVIEAKALYLKTKAALDGSDQEEKEIVWHEAQLLLTRLSYTGNQLDSIVYSETLKPMAVGQQAQSLKFETDEFVAAERQLLIGLKP